MTDFFAAPAVQASALIVILCVLIAIGYAVVSNFRNYDAEDEGSVDVALSKLQEMRLKGDISEEEFRTIQTTTRQQSDGLVNPCESPDGDSPKS